MKMTKELKEWLRIDKTVASTELQKYTYNNREYYVDYRLKQFRSNTKQIEFIDFDSLLGDLILCKMIKDGVADFSKLDL